MQVCSESCIELGHADGNMHLMHVAAEQGCVCAASDLICM